ncbi:porphobilinogen deaminase [Myriangium duriaei CBS 260.36]|uniref:Porphobilinogen deaminase n=1 Tax=Myriangium duriaei CBS 260.36 TaxID=1168546 RepID=A0A9P4IQK8_9PEZI|nr:porphobilinogen deaminase [Myriangium duriaei CBS 260.36]
MSAVVLPSDPATPLSADTTSKSSPSARTENVISIGTRKSPMARIQTAQVASAITKAHPHLSTRTIALETIGDLNQTTPLPDFNAKALWTTELEELLSSGEVDMIVHSLKDMPTQLPAGMALGAVTHRDDPRDAVCMAPALVAKGIKTLSQLPPGSTVGTSSLRRSAQLKRKYPGLKFADCRGNVGTRLGKLDAKDGPFSALILAAAGLERLGVQSRITQRLSWADGGVMHAVGQGALGIEIREDDERLRKVLGEVLDEKSFRAALAERSLLRTLEGGCSVPIGVETEWVPRARSLATTEGAGVGVGAKPAAEYHQLSGQAVTGPEAEKKQDEDQRSDELLMRAVVVSLDGTRAVEADMRRFVRSREEADQLGWDIAGRLVEQGAGEILKEINLNRGIIKEQGKA